MSVTAATGFLASAVHAGIRRSKPDIALVRSAALATGAAMFTRNRMQAAPVVVSKRHLELAEPQAVVVNSGVANAATGAQGERDAHATAAHAARMLRLRPEEVLVLSTGVIGVPLPLEKVLAGVTASVCALSTNGDGVAHAIMTTDTHPKQAMARGEGYVVGGMAKGSGMIHPDLATMLAIVTTDYALPRGDAEAFLRVAVDESFNSISVDGECSTNDTVVLLANGASGVSHEDESFVSALRSVCANLASQVVADGEGATLVAAINVSGAASTRPQFASRPWRAVLTSGDVAIRRAIAFASSALAAAGSAPFNGGYAKLAPERVTLDFDGVRVLERGTPLEVEPELGEDTVTIELDLGLGGGEAAYLTSDLSSEYVAINADYRS